MISFKTYKMVRFFTILLLVFALFSCIKKEKIQPNIILILTDDQGWGDLSVNGNTNIETPNIDNLAKQGIIFDRFYVCAVCSPTRAEILTGRYHVRSGVWSTGAGGERMDLDEITVADLFKNAGYQTAAYGKWHNGMQPPYHPNSRGFDDFYGFCSGHWGNYFSPMLEHNGAIVKGNGFIIDDFTDRGIEFIEKNKNNPFFLYLPFNTPHSPMQVPDLWWNKYKNKNLEMFHHDKEPEDTLFTRAALAMCENIDWNVGRISQKIEELGLSEKTIIIYLSDNGPNSWRWNGGMKGRKGSTDEGGVRSPMIMKWEGYLTAGKKINEIAAGIDLLPTLADLAGIEINLEKPLDGKSLKPLLLEKNRVWDDRIIVSYWNKKTSLRNQRFRLGSDNKLYEIASDPGQNTDVSEKYPEVFNQLRAAKEKWILEVSSELDETANRPFTIGHHEAIFTQMPARDGIAHGNIKRSNRWPNSSYYLNWISKNDSITWPAEVLEDGWFEVELFYTCPEKDTGSKLQLYFNDAKLDYQITEAFESELMKNDDIYPREEGYVKKFNSVKMGVINLKKGTGTLTLKATEIPGKQVIDFRLLVFKRI